MRTRRRLGVAAGTAAVVAAAMVAVPSLLDRPAHPAPVTRHGHTPKVTVTRLGGHVVHGLIARGAIDKKAWRITFDRTFQNNVCILVAGDRPACAGGTAPSVSGIASMDGQGSTRWNSVVCPVRRDVTRISIRLSDRVVLDLHPFAAFGYRWIGLVVPHKLQMVEAIAYSGQRELGYSIPFVDASGFPIFVQWLRPGQVGPARVTRLLGSGVAAGQEWSVVGHSGPWGHCEVLRSPSDSSAACSAIAVQASAGLGVDTTLSSAPGQPRWVIGAVPPSVGYLQLTMSDRSTVRVPTVEFAGAKYFVLALTSNPSVVHWGAYDSAGRKVLGGQGSPELRKPQK